VIVADEPQKPRPPVRGRTIHELRAEVKAKDKFALVAMADDQVPAFMAENYRTDADSAAAFVAWLRGNGTGKDPVPARPQPNETWHRQGDEAAGTERLLPDAESAKVRAAAAAAAPKKKKK
jgi:hypothetical protein